MEEPIRFIKLSRVLDRVGVGKTKFYEMVNNGEFPKPVKHSAGQRWVESEVVAWQQARMAEREGEHGQQK